MAPRPRGPGGPDRGGRPPSRPRAAADPARLAAIRSDLPVYIAVGDQQARHEILNETHRDEVEADLLRRLDRVVPSGSRSQ